MINDIASSCVSHSWYYGISTWLTINFSTIRTLELHKIPIVRIFKIFILYFIIFYLSVILHTFVNKFLFCAYVCRHLAAPANLNLDESLFLRVGGVISREIRGNLGHVKGNLGHVKGNLYFTMYAISIFTMNTIFIKLCNKLYFTLYCFINISQRYNEYALVRQTVISKRSVKSIRQFENV
jgi:hypothetical protein